MSDPVFQPTFMDGIDSYYYYVATKLAQLGERAQGLKLGGMVQAQDWPEVEVIPGTANLLYLSSVPIGRSKANPTFVHFMQWSWITTGEDIGSSSNDTNRGDRFRESLAIQNGLLLCHYPGFTDKYHFAPNEDNTVAANPFTPGESISWTQLQFRPMNNTKAGLIYGVATFEITSTEEIGAVAQF